MMPNVGLPPINYDDPHLYEHLSLIIDEFEKAALRSEQRQAMMATAQSPLSAMDQILASSDRALNMNRTANAKTSSGDSADTSDQWKTPGFRLEGSGLDDSGNSDGEAPAVESHNDLRWISSGETKRSEATEEGEIPEIPQSSFTVGAEGSVGFDADFNELMNGDPNGAQLGDWIKDCFGCDLRVSFDWQLQPIDLLSPLAGLLQDINIALDQFDYFFDENKLMEQLCDLLNGLNFLCIPDLLAILMALKMLLKSYLTFQLSIKVDWTLLLGPLLKLILDAIVTLLQQIAGIIVAPLDCAYAALMSIANLQDTLAETAAMAVAVGARVTDRASVIGSVVSGNGFPGFEDTEIEADARLKDVSTTHKTVQGNQDDGGELPDIQIPALDVSSRDADKEAAEGAAFSLPTGFEINADTKLPTALKDPQFLQSNPFKKLALSVKEARDYIMDLVRKVILALRSLESLVSGSLSLSLGNLGLILFVRDMIRLIMIVIQLFKGRKVDDWCEYLSNNPEVMDGVIAGAKGSYDAEREKIVLTRGPEVVAEINTCATGRTDAQSALMQKWVKDLKRSGSI